MSRQYVTVRFRPGQGRTYTYHNDGEPVAAGDEVDIDGTHGRQTLRVITTSLVKPSFTTKPIIGKHRPPAPVPDELALDTNVDQDPANDDPFA